MLRVDQGPGQAGTKKGENYEANVSRIASRICFVLGDVMVEAKRKLGKLAISYGYVGYDSPNRP